MTMGSPTAGPPPGAERIEFDEPAYESIRTRAMARALQMLDRHGSYGSSNAEQHEVGLLGEEAVRVWLLRLGWDALSIADGLGAGNSRGDISVRLRNCSGGLGISGAVTIEVKTARLQDWSRYERELNARQFAGMTCDAIVWCATPSKRPRRWVDVMGWVPRDGMSVIDAPVTSTRRSQVRVQNDLKVPHELGDWLTEAQANIWF